VVPVSGIGQPTRRFIIVVVCAFLGYSAYDSVQEKRKTEEIREEAEGARVDIGSVQFVDAGKSPDVPYAFFNFYYKNNGHLTAQGCLRWFGVFANDKLFTKKEIDNLFSTLERNPYVFNTNDQIQAGNEGHFSEPHNYDNEQKAIEQTMPYVKDGKTQCAEAIRVLIQKGNRDGRRAGAPGSVGRYPFEAGAYCNMMPVLKRCGKTERKAKNS